MKMTNYLSLGSDSCQHTVLICIKSEKKRFFHKKIHILHKILILWNGLIV